ncbi:MAG: hypothetical protein AAGD25_07070 [Cyanobacteria bacterium P01_F01_bin.150]
MIEQKLVEQIAKKLIILSMLAISGVEKDIIKETIHKELKEFNELDVMKVFFMNRYKYAFPTLFLALNEVWNRFDFKEWLEIIQDLGNHLDGLVAWIFYSNKYMKIDGLTAALASSFISTETKELLKNRLKKSETQQVDSHLEELLAWGVNFDSLHQRMVDSGGPSLK